MPRGLELIAMLLLQQERGLKAAGATMAPIVAAMTSWDLELCCSAAIE